MTRTGDRLIYRVRGSGFLKHMVRNIVGVLIEAGKGNLTREISRSASTPAARSRRVPRLRRGGLFLVSVEY